MSSERKHNWRFMLFMIPAFALWLIGQYAFPIFTTDQLNIIVPYFIENNGWSPTQITDPGTIGRLLCIPFTLFWGWVIIKWGAKNVFCTSLFLFGASEILVATHPSYALYALGLGAIMVFGTALLMSTFSVINNWFRSWRGTALGIVTLVSPLGNATSVSFLGHGTATIGFTPTFMLMSCIVAGLGIVGLFIVRETPEQLGLYPDGALVAPPPEILQNDALVDKIRFKHIFRYKEAWLHCLIFGICAFGLTVYPGFFVPRFTELGFSPGQITAFTYGFSLFGGGLSFISGIIDDKLGTRTATMMIMALFFFGTIGLRFGTPDRPWMIWVGIVSLGGIVGAYPNLNPSLVAYTYGRKCFSHVFRFINTGVYILPSFGFYFATRLYEVHGSYNLPYTLMMPISLLGLLCVFLANKKHDLTIDIEKELKAKEKLADTES